jgi:CheY-like chemotaxis protein
MIASPVMPATPAGDGRAQGMPPADGPILDVHQAMTKTACKIAAPFDDIEAADAGNFEQAGKIPPPRVLVVDDEPLIRWSVSESLGDLGFEVQTAPDAASALKIVTTSRWSFRVVVLDLRLPDMHDLSLLGTIRQLLPRAHLILMTAYGSPEVMTDARAMGADVLSKPFELGELCCLVSKDGSDLD